MTGGGQISDPYDTAMYLPRMRCYTCVAIRAGRGSTGYRLMRVSFWLHAVARLVKRSPVALAQPLLASVDAEAVMVLAGADLIADGEDHSARATGQGLWAGSLDTSRMEGGCDLTYANPAAQIPVFSARTWLSPDKMRPTRLASGQPGEDRADTKGQEDADTTALRDMLAASGLPQNRQDMLFNLGMFHKRAAKPAWGGV